MYEFVPYTYKLFFLFTSLSWVRQVKLCTKVRPLSIIFLVFLLHPLQNFVIAATLCHLSSPIQSSSYPHLFMCFLIYILLTISCGIGFHLIFYIYSDEQTLGSMSSKCCVVARYISGI